MKEDLFGSVRVADVLNVTDEAKARLLSDTVTVTEAKNKNPNDVGFVQIETQNGDRLGYLGEAGRDIFNASFELVKPKIDEDLFHTVVAGDKLRCVSHELGLHKFGWTYDVNRVSKTGDKTIVHLPTDFGSIGPWGNPEKFNECFERVEQPKPIGEERPFTGETTGTQTLTVENPKDLIGNTKLGLRHVPLGALYEMAVAMDDGARKYGPFNWRAHPVRADVYVDAAKRHMEAWVHGEERAGDSGGHHLAHAMACMAILLDAQHHGTLKDNRDTNAKNFYDIIDQIQKERDAAKKVLDDKK